MYQNNRYTQARDRTPLAWRTDGAGPALVLTNGYATSNSYWTYVIERFRKSAQVITWDLKGHGRSGAARRLDEATIEGSADDLLRVMDAAGVDQATLMGFSLGCQIILEAWRRAPERISALVPILGPYERPFDTAFPPGVGRLLFEAMRRAGPIWAGAALKGLSLVSRHPVPYMITKWAGLVGPNVDYRDMEPFFEHLAQIDGPTWAALGVAAQSHSAGDVLASISVPTLIVAGGNDSFAPAEIGQAMQQAITGSQLLVVPKASHTGILGHGERIEDEIEYFLAQHHLIDT